MSHRTNLEASLLREARMELDRRGSAATPSKMPDLALTGLLADVEGVLMDYIDTLERQGAMLNWGRAMLARVRARRAYENERT
jgi:hypothetical protein